MPHLTPDAKHHILLHYQPNLLGCGFTALAQKHSIKGGGSVIRDWYKRWDGTPASLCRKSGSGRKSLLTPAQVKRTVVAPVRLANRAHRAINYRQVAAGVRRITGKSPSLRTVQRLGHGEQIKDQPTNKRTHKEISASHCEELADSRRKLQRCGLDHVLFLDETHLRTSEAPRRTLTASGELPLVVVEDTTAYAPRYDMIACCTSKGALPPIIWTPADRKGMQVKGINKKMLLDYIHDTLAQACAALDVYPLYLVMDKARIHNTSHILEAFHEAGCEDMKEIILMPTQGAKRMSPLDNSLFHVWKDACRKHPLITDRTIVRIMADEWNRFTEDDITPHYKHCLISGRADPYGDCPQPHAHNHAAPRRRAPAIH